MATAGHRPTIVLERRARADASSWAGVIRRLQREGYTVDAPPDPLRSLAYGSSYLCDFLSPITGPVILVGHSYDLAVQNEWLPAGATDDGRTHPETPAQVSDQVGDRSRMRGEPSRQADRSKCGERDVNNVLLQLQWPGGDP